MKATPSGQTNIHGRPVGKLPGSVPLNHISDLSDTLVGRSRWDDPLVKLEAELALGKNDKAAWHFVNKCRKKMTLAYKRNMKIIAEEEKAAFGRNSYFRLVARGLYQEPKCEGDFTAADISTSSDEDSMSADNACSSNEDNIEGNNVEEDCYNDGSQNKQCSDENCHSEDEEDEEDEDDESKSRESEREESEGEDDGSEEEDDDFSLYA